MALWSVYLVRCSDGALYTGIATDVARRFEEHVEGRGAKSLRGRGPLELVFEREVESRSTALKLEYRIKQLAKADKEALATGALPFEQLAESAREVANEP